MGALDRSRLILGETMAVSLAGAAVCLCLGAVGCVLVVHALTAVGEVGSRTMPERPGAVELDAGALRRTDAGDVLGFGSTKEVEPLDGTVGQARANEAISFGLEAEMAGYNIFATGPVGVGKRTSVESRLHEHARQRAAPGDWVYLHNFREPRRPIAVALASGQGQKLAGDIRRFLEDARRELAAAFESDTYAGRQREVTEPIEREQ